MGTPEWKQRIYDSYVSNGFGKSHDVKRYEMQRRYFKKNYLKYMPKSKDCKILELGCGRGEFYYFCKKEGYKNYKGIDASVECVSYIKKYFGKDSNVSVNNIFDLLQVSEKAGGYDAIILNDVIEHLTKPEIFDVLDKVYANLNKDGIFLIKTPNMANPFVAAASRYIGFDHEIGFTEYSMNQILFATGYKDVKIIGTDIYVINPIINIVARLISKIVNGILFCFLHCMEGQA